MRGQRVSFYWGGILFLLLTATVLMGFITQGAAQSGEENSKVRSDVVTIDKMAEFGTLELPPVTFLHDKHTEALADEEKPCLSCHEEDKETGHLVFSFKGTDEVDASGMKEAFHDGCISCHEEYRAKGEDTGPSEGQCRSCHSEEPPVSDRQPMDLDKVLHYRHIAAEEIPDLKIPGQEDENCGQCHHYFDKQAGKLMPAVDNEENCSLCHLEEPYKLEDAEDVVVSDLSTASHLQCVNCHRDLKLAKVENSGPVECASCHGIVDRKQVEADNAKVLESLGGEVPRLERGQPDAAMVTAIQPDDYAALKEDEQPRTMAPVPFDHMAHEQAVEDCSSCHHKGIKSCNSCHTIEGKEEGGFVQLSEAMHSPTSERSCVGCHETKKQEPTCAGCHETMEQPAVLDEEACGLCHQEPVRSNTGEGMETAAQTDPMKLSAERQNEMAAMMLEGRASKPGLYAQEDIPETVVIDAMADEYKPVEFPHRRIVNYLADQVAESGMGGYFHSQEGLLCQGCHHNSPVSADPPSCASCHGKPFDESRPNRPGLKAAYHGQCMDCHTAMGIEGKEIVKGKPVPANTDCTGCHAEKK